MIVWGKELHNIMCCYSLLYIAWILYSIVLTVIMLAILIFILAMVLFDFVREWVLEQFVLIM